MSLYNTLFPFQKNIVDKFKDRSRFGLFLDCGLGKTLVSLAFTEVNQCTKVIVISINAKAEETIDVSGSWMWWANKSDIKYNFYNKRIFKPLKKYPNAFTKDTNDFLLLNFESLYTRGTTKFSIKKEIEDFIKTCKGHKTAIIIDESHKIKNISSSQTKAVSKIFQLCKMYSSQTYLYLGTGTLFTAGLEDIYAQIHLLGWEGNKQIFTDTFCIRDRIPGLPEWQQPIIGYKNVKKLYDIVHEHGITIESKDVQDLPQQIYINHMADETPEFNLLTSDKAKMKDVNVELISRNLPYIISQELYMNMTNEEKAIYWSLLNIKVIDHKLMLEGDYELGDLNDNYNDILNFLASIYDHIEDLGCFEWLRDYYYLFLQKENKQTHEKWHVGRPYKPNNLMNNPFYRNFAFPELYWDAETKGALWLRARQMSSGFQGNEQSYKWYDSTRLKMLKDFLETHEDNYILFYNYVPEFIAIYEICQELGYKVDVYNGSVKDLKYYETYEAQEEGKRMLNTKNIILSNFASGSTGKNWQLFNKCILFSMPIYRDFAQGIKRIHRTGQKYDCIYHIFYQNNWLDKGMRESLEQKVDYNEDMFEADLKRVKELMKEADE